MTYWSPSSGFPEMIIQRAGGHLLDGIAKMLRCFDDAVGVEHNRGGLLEKERLIVQRPGDVVNLAQPVSDNIEYLFAELFHMGE